MSALTNRLGRLSTELLRTIAVFCDGQSLIAFTATCRSIRQACHDSLVYQDLIRGKLRDAESTDIEITKVQLKAIITRAQNDIYILIRYAVALSKVDSLPEIQEMLSRPTGTFDAALREAMTFVPQLLTLGHSRVCSARVATMVILGLLNRTPRYHQDTLIQVAFCFACESTKSQTDSQWPVASLAFGSTIVKEFLQLDDPFQSLGCQENLYFLLGLFMRSTNGENTPSSSSLPILFQDLTALPLLFDGVPEADGEGPWRRWLRHISSILASDSSLEGSEWCGYQCDDPFFILPSSFIQNIQLHVIRAGTEIALRGHGYENGEYFSLEGRVDPATGRVTINLDYPDERRNHWHGCITPFGIFGYWEMERGYRFEGWFWIWRTTSANPIDPVCFT
ncbi:hypothetical protein GGS24DRAFT_515973 [Hypoxylon argillaceum]|nr:hypothetical protein GGS24DRAFT_515973 [Hypoxylon argillaceum]